MAGVNIDINLRTRHDSSGAVAAKRDVEGVRTAANGASDAFESVRSAVGGVSRAIGLLNRAMALGGIVGLVMSAVNAFRAWQEKVESLRKSHEDLARAIADVAHREKIDAAADAYQKLTAAMARAHQEQLRVNSAIEDAAKAFRDQADAESRLAEARAIAAVDPYDSDRERKIADIRRRFELERAEDAVSRREEDASSRAAALEGEAAADTENASRLQAVADEIEAQLVEAQARAAVAKEASESDNSADRYQTRGEIRHLATGGAYLDVVEDRSAPMVRTAEGDKIRSEALQDYQRSSAEADALRSRFDEIVRQIQELRAESSRKEAAAQTIRSDAARLAATDRATIDEKRNADINDARAAAAKEEAAAARARAIERAGTIKTEISDIDRRRHELEKASDSAPTGNIALNDRISALGGFASSAAAAVAGVGIRPAENPELKRLESLVQKLHRELEDINRNTKDNTCTLG